MHLRYKLLRKTKNKKIQNIKFGNVFYARKKNTKKLPDRIVIIRQIYTRLYDRCEKDNRGLHIIFYILN